ncbi:MAG UNVERIFIED_CONTAM: hypothetical protein LVT10_05975 [Anaerolineae bacterium]|jgi:GT2 family glycosyltransferase
MHVVLWGNRFGIQAARGECVLLLNPDTAVEAGALERIGQPLRHHPNYAGATAQLVSANGPTQQTCSRLIPFRYLLYTLTRGAWCALMQGNASNSIFGIRMEGFNHHRP